MYFILLLRENIGVKIIGTPKNDYKSNETSQMKSALAFFCFYINLSLRKCNMCMRQIIIVSLGV